MSGGGDLRSTSWWGCSPTSRRVTTIKEKIAQLVRHAMTPCKTWSILLWHPVPPKTTLWRLVQLWYAISGTCYTGIMTPWDTLNILLWHSVTPANLWHSPQRACWKSAGVMTFWRAPQLSPPSMEGNSRTGSTTPQRGRSTWSPPPNTRDGPAVLEMLFRKVVTFPKLFHCLFMFVQD